MRCQAAERKAEMKTLLLFLIFVILLALCFHRHGRAGETVWQDETFIFEPGDRRDPFSFTRQIPHPVEPLNPVVVDLVDPLKLDPAAVAQKRMDALTQYSLAEQSLMSDNAADAVQRCDAGLEVFHDVALHQYRELQEIRDTLLRLRKAAERAKMRADVEREFSMMQLHVTGIVFRDRNPQAIVNAAVVSKGDVVNETVIVADIRQNEVCVLYKGFKLALEVQK